MKVLTYTLYKEHCELYTEIHGSSAVNSCQIELAQKDMILLSNVSIILYNAGSRTGVENNKFKHFNLSAGTYSIDDSNEKMKKAVLQKRQDWEPPQIKDLKLVIIEHCTFKASSAFFITFGILYNYLEKTTLKQVNPTPWLIRNIHWYITSPKIIITTSWTNQQSKKRVRWAAIKFVGLHARF